MTKRTRSLRSHAAWAAVFTLVLAAAPPATASVVSASPTLPLLGVPYVAAAGVGCFAAAGVCIDSGMITPDSLVSSTFNATGQDIITNMLFTGMLTDLAHNPLGTVTLTGTAEQQVLGRTFSSETGTWITELLALSLTGSVLGHTLTLALDTAMPSTGGASVDLLPGPEPLYRIDSFFDVFVELTLDTPIPLRAQRGPVHLEARALPEPAPLALLGVALLWLAWRRRRVG